MGLDARAVDRVERARRQIARLARNKRAAPAGEPERERALSFALLAAFPDRVARRRRRGERDLVLANGKVARLSEDSVVHDAMMLVALDAEERPGRGTVVRLASAVDDNLLYELDPERLELRDELSFVSEGERVERVSSMRWGALVLEETRALAPPSEKTARVLAAAARAIPSRFLRSKPALELAVRLALVAEHFPDAGLPGDVTPLFEEALLSACAGASSFAELERVGWLSFATATLPERQRRLLESEAPLRLTLPGGRNVAVHYEQGRPPYVESRLQDFFGSAEGPRILGGKVPLTLHLLAPNQRAVQVTTDLAGFWQRHYPSVRKELMRRYPRHAWPEDGRTAEPPAPKRR
jgi:ATP-dependent helicase HrpB